MPDDARLPDPAIPREALLPLPEVVRLTNLCQAEIYSRMKLGTFPVARQVSLRKIAWIGRELIAWLEAPQAFAPKVEPQLFSESEIIEAARDHHATGVYFLIAGGRIVYIGRSHNVFSRVAEHRLTKSFDAWHFILCKPSEVSALESAYIKKYQPPLNVIGVRYNARQVAYE